MMVSGHSQFSMAVIIPTMGRRTLLRTIESLMKNRGIGNVEIIVVGVIADKHVEDALDRLAESHPNLRHLSLRFETGDASRKRNAGADASTAPILAFLDDDVHVPADWIDEMRLCFNDGSAGLVSGPSLVPDDIPMLARLAGLSLSSRAAGNVSARYLTGDPHRRPIKWSGIIGCNMLFRRDVFMQLGGFDPGFYPGEEMKASFMTSRLGYTLIFNPNAPVFHYPKQTFRGFWKQIYRYGATRIRLMRSGVEVEWGPMVPGLWVLSIVLLGVGAWFSQWLLYLLMVEFVLYAFVIAWFTLEVVLQTGRWSDLLLLFMQPFMHLSYGAGIWVELLRPGRDLGDAPEHPTN